MTTKIEIPQSTPIVEKIEITKLPEKLQKKALIFDKDKSNYIETKNNNGINEMALLEPFAKAMGLDLDKYKTSVYENKSTDGTVRTVTVEKSENYQRVDEMITNERKNRFDYEYKTDHYAFGKIYGSNSEVSHGTTNIVTTSTYSNHQNLTNGKYNLTVMTEYSEIIDDRTYPAKTKSSTKQVFELNGKPVQAKPIGKGRYEVSDEKGNVSYISHDGVKLKPEYVRSNP